MQGWKRAHDFHQPVLSCSFEELSDTLGGSGRAKMVWDVLRKGENPFELTRFQLRSEYGLSDKLIDL
eukprot:330554-Alexandrium_andersonii.AAC.1